MNFGVGDLVVARVKNHLHKNGFVEDLSYIP